MARQLGALLILLRERQGYSQKEVADKLCELSGQMTVTRHEVSRWEREERVPTNFWLGWLSKVLEATVSELAEARARSKGEDKAVTEIDKVPEKVTGTKWRDYARSIRERSLALVTLKFEHRSTSVQLSATYEEPEQATAAIGMFRRMVTPGTATRLNGTANGVGATSGNGTGGVEAVARTGTTPVKADSSARRPTTLPPGAQARAPARAAAALTANGAARVPMGIRYTKGPGSATSGSDRASG